MEAARAELNKLQQERAALEAEINERSARLNAPGQPGMHESLIDKEGFPRADIDVHAVRLDRNAVIRLTNDHKAISQRMEQALHKLHALARESGVTSMAGNGTTAAPAGVGGQPATHEDKKPRTDAAATAAAMEVAAAALAPAAAAAAATRAAATAAPVSLRPYAVVDEVAEGSPAAAAGIQLGDQLCRFGAAVAGGGDELQRVAQELAAHEGQPVQTVFLRAGQQVELTLTPQRWSGRGLLGCHLRPL